MNDGYTYSPIHLITISGASLSHDKSLPICRVTIQIGFLYLQFNIIISGFLSTNDANANGNYALLDLLAVLQWLKQNIGEFRGDVNRITLFGHGYGAALVNLLMLSPMFDDSKSALNFIIVLLPTFSSNTFY